MKESERETSKQHGEGEEARRRHIKCFYCRLLVQEQGTDQPELSEN